MEVNDIRQQVQTAHGEQSQDDGSRDVLLRAQNFFAQVAEVIEAVVSPHGRNQGGQQGTDRSQTQRRDQGCRFDRILLSEKHARDHNHHDRAYLQGCQQHLDSPAHAHTQIIDRGDGQHDQRRERLGCGEGEIVSSDMACEQGRSHNREQESGESQKSGRQRSHRHRPLKKRTHPAEEKPPEGAETAVEVDVGAACFGERRAQFGITEGAEKHDEPADNPGGKNELG